MRKNKVLEFLIITLGTAIVAGSVYFFLQPADIPLGSVAGLSIILNKVLPFPVSAINLTINIGLLVIGFIFIGREFGAKTVYTSILTPVLMGVFERLVPDRRSIMGDPLLDIACFMFICCIGLTILFKNNASSGGLDILAKILNKYLHVDLGKAMALAGLVAAGTSLFVYDLRTVLLSLLFTYINGIILDHFIFSFGGKKRVCIISKKEEEVRRYILDTINRGATIYDVIGAYDGSHHREIITLVDQSEYGRLIDWLAKEDPDAFISVYSVGEVRDNSKRVPKPKKSN